MKNFTSSAPQVFRKVGLAGILALAAAGCGEGDSGGKSTVTDLCHEIPPAHLRCAADAIGQVLSENTGVIAQDGVLTPPLGYVTAIACDHEGLNTEGTFVACAQAAKDARARVELNYPGAAYPKDGLPTGADVSHRELPDGGTEVTTWCAAVSMAYPTAIAEAKFYDPCKFSVAGGIDINSVAKEAKNYCVEIPDANAAVKKLDISCQ